MTWLSNDLVERLRDVASRPELASDRYVILRPIGRGGMGSVYAARDEQLGREVAIKVSNAAAPADDLDRVSARRRASCETRTSRDRARARCRAVGRRAMVLCHETGPRRNAGRPRRGARARSRATGGLRARRGDRGVRPRRWYRASRFEAVKRDGRAFGEVLVLDWGVARVLARAEEEKAASARTTDRHSNNSMSGTSGGTRMGTAGFMAPEQADGDSSNAGPPADVYALGALFYWMWTGRAAPADVNDISRRLGAASPAPSKRLAAMIRKCLSLAPTDQYASAAELMDDLARYRQGSSVSAHRETTIERAGRWLVRYQTFVLLVLVVLVMRVAFAFLR